MIPCPFCGVAPDKIYDTTAGFRVTECETPKCPISGLAIPVEQWEKRAVTIFDEGQKIDEIFNILVGTLRTVYFRADGSSYPADSADIVGLVSAAKKIVELYKADTK